MKYILTKLISFLIVFFILFSCASDKQLLNKQQEANYYFNEGNIYADKAGHDYEFGNYLVITADFTQAQKGKGEFNQALYYYIKALEMNPRDPKIYNNRGVVYTKMGQFDKAISDYNKAIEINPRYALAYYNRGNAYWDKCELGKFDDQVVSNYNKAIGIDPGFANAYNNRGTFHAAHGKYDRAISDYTKALEINPRFALAYYNRGIIYFNKDEHDKRISDDMAKAIEIKPDFGEAYFFLDDEGKWKEFGEKLSSHIPNLIRMPSERDK